MNERDKELDVLLDSLRKNEPSPEQMLSWSRALNREEKLQKRKLWITKTGRDILKIAAGVLIGIGTSFAYFSSQHSTPFQTASVERVRAVESQNNVRDPDGSATLVFVSANSEW